MVQGIEESKSFEPPNDTNDYDVSSKKIDDLINFYNSTTTGGGFFDIFRSKPKKKTNEEARYGKILPIGWKGVIKKIKNKFKSDRKDFDYSVFNQDIWDDLYVELDKDINLYLLLRLYEDKKNNQEQCVNNVTCTFERKKFLYKYFKDLCKRYPNECESFHGRGIVSEPMSKCDIEIEGSLPDILNYHREKCDNKIQDAKTNKYIDFNDTDELYDFMKSRYHFDYDSKNLDEKMNLIHEGTRYCNEEIPPFVSQKKQYSEKTNSDKMLRETIWKMFAHDDESFKKLMKGSIYKAAKDIDESIKRLKEFLEKYISFTPLENQSYEDFVVKSDPKHKRDFDDDTKRFYNEKSAWLKIWNEKFKETEKYVGEDKIVPSEPAVFWEDLQEKYEDLEKHIEEQLEKNSLSYKANRTNYQKIPNSNGVRIRQLQTYNNEDDNINYPKEIPKPGDPDWIPLNFVQKEDEEVKEMMEKQSNHELLNKIDSSRKENGLIELSPELQKLLNRYLWKNIGNSNKLNEKQKITSHSLRDYKVNKKPFVLKKKVSPQFKS